MLGKPGGKIVYTDLGEASNNEVPMGHEIAHAVARHSVERAVKISNKQRSTILDIALEVPFLAIADDYLVGLGLTLPFNDYKNRRLIIYTS